MKNQQLSPSREKRRRFLNGAAMYSQQRVLIAQFILTALSLSSLAWSLWACEATSTAASSKLPKDCAKHALQNAAAAAQSSSSSLYRARTVFLDGAPWTADLSSKSRAFFISTYPVKLRARTTSNQTVVLADGDDTRLYPQMDSRDTPGMERRMFPEHEFDPHCEPMADWQRTFHPVCNELHASPLDENLIEEEYSRILRSGYWRHAWRIKEPRNGPTIVWRTLKMAHNMEERYFEFNRMDAVAMERLTASRSVVDIYGFCGMSVLTEYAGSSLRKTTQKMPMVQKLEFAIHIAQGIADIHGIDGGGDQVSLVHNDVNLYNIIVTPDNRPVLNDFNIAIPVMKHNETGETCPFASHFPNPQWRAPEEQRVEGSEVLPHVNEKGDIYALGNVFFLFLAGLNPWKQKGKPTDREKKLVVTELKLRGERPPLPQGIAESTDPATQLLIKAMNMCYENDPKERPSAAEIVAFLRKESAVLLM